MDGRQSVNYHYSNDAFCDTTSADSADANREVDKARILEAYLKNILDSNQNQSTSFLNQRSQNSEGNKLENSVLAHQSGLKLESQDLVKRFLETLQERHAVQSLEDSMRRDKLRFVASEEINITDRSLCCMDYRAAKQDLDRSQKRPKLEDTLQTHYDSRTGETTVTMAGHTYTIDMYIPMNGDSEALGYPMMGPTETYNQGCMPHTMYNSYMDGNIPTFCHEFEEPVSVDCRTHTNSLSDDNTSLDSYSPRSRGFSESVMEEDAQCSPAKPEENSILDISHSYKHINIDSDQSNSSLETSNDFVLDRTFPDLCGNFRETQALDYANTLGHTSANSINYPQQVNSFTNMLNDSTPSVFYTNLSNAQSSVMNANPSIIPRPLVPVIDASKGFGTSISASTVQSVADSLLSYSMASTPPTTSYEMLMNRPSSSVSMQTTTATATGSTSWDLSSMQSSASCSVAKESPHFEDEFLSTATNGRGSKPKRFLKPGCRLWEFIRNLLFDPAKNPSIICWEDRNEGVFRLVNSKEIACIWGRMKGNQKMSYEKLSRAMRYYYKRKVFEPVLGKRLLYKFGPKATGWRDIE